MQSLFDGDKMKRLARHRWPMLGAKATFGKILGRKNAEAVNYSDYLFLHKNDKRHTITSLYVNMANTISVLLCGKDHVNLSLQSFRSVSSGFISAFLALMEIEDPSLRIESFADINLHDVSTNDQ